MEDSKQQQPARAVSSMSEAERREELSQLTALVATLGGAEHKKKRTRVNGRITSLRQSLGLTAEETKPAPAAKAVEAKPAATQPVAAAKSNGKNRKESGAAAPRKESAAAPAPAAAPRKDSGADNHKQGGKPRSESKSATPEVDVLKAPPAGKVVLGYWKIRGLAEPIRYVLEYTKTPYVEKLYTVGPAPEFKSDHWLEHKKDPKLGLDFPNLPYYLEPKLRVTQSAAILRHLARKNKLCGDSEEEHTIVDMLAEEVIDWRKKIMGICYNPQFDELLKDVIATVMPDFTSKWEGYLSTKKFLLGDKLTYADFCLYTLIDQANVMTNFLAKAPGLSAYHANIRNLPAIKAYLASDRFQARPINNLMARFK